MTQVGAETDPARGLAVASADLMQSLNNLLESLDSHHADSSSADASARTGNSAHQAQAQPVELEPEVASRTSPATLVPDGRTEPGVTGWQQHAPRFQGFVGELHGLTNPIFLHGVACSSDRGPRQQQQKFSKLRCDHVAVKHDMVCHAAGL